MPKKTPAPAALPAVAPAPQLARFQHLVSSMAVAARSEALISASPPAPIAPEIDSAWRRLISPKRIAALALTARSHSSSSYFFNAYSRGGAQNINQRVFPLLSDADCSLIAPALRQCAADIAAASASEPFERAAKLHAALIAAPSGDAANPSLSFPFMGLALRPNKTLVDGKRSPSLGAAWLAQAGDADFVEAHPDDWRHQAHGRRLTAEAWLEPAGLEGAALDEASAALGAAREVMPDRRDSDREKPLVAQRFAAALTPASGTSAFSSDLPLPRVGLIKQSLAETGWRTVVPLGLGDAKFKRSEIPAMKSKTAIEALKHLASGALALSLARADSTRTLGNELSDRLSLYGGPLSHAMPMINSVKEAQRGYYRQDLTSNLLGETSLANAAFNEKFPAAQTDEAIDAFLGPAYAQSGKASSEALNFEPLGGKGRGLPGLAHALEGSDARLGMIQWAVSAFESAKGVQRAIAEPEKDYDYDDDRRRREREELRAELLPERLELVNAILSVREAIKASQRAFIDATLNEAEAVEKAWLEERGFGPAWRQAQAGGEISSQTLAWAMANPASDLLASEDPMLNLGARCAKAWGLRVESPLDEAAFAQRFEAALEEMGAGAQARAALLASEPLRDQIAKLSSQISSTDKAVGSLAKTALGFTLRLAQRAAAGGMEPDQIAKLCRAYADLEPRSGRFNEMNPASRLAHFNSAYWDGFGPELGDAHVSSAPAARLIKALSEGKSAHYDQFLDALARDWRETLEAHAKAASGDGKTAEDLARARAEEIVSTYPRRSPPAIDWRKPVFEAPVWSVLGSVSPRFSAACLSASAQGELGAWCVSVARGLGIRDAADGNDLIGKTREAIKAASGLSDGAWKQMIKSPQALRLLASSMGIEAFSSRYRDQVEAQHSYDPNAFLGEADASTLAATRGAASEPAPDPYGYRNRAHKADGETTARFFSSAARLNLSMPSVLAAADALLPHPELFGASSAKTRVSGADGAAFYLQEAQAKADREPYLIKEAAKRFEKFQRDALTPPPEGEVAIDPARALRDETRDLADWIGQSETGVWQTVPPQPTWGQLRRASGEWHAEQAAMARDRLERQQAKEQRELAAREARRDAQRARPPRLGHQPAFEDTSAERAKEAAKPKKLMGDFGGATGAGWPKIVGRHARDGWQAVELLTAAQLTEEGAAMSHCVSSYSGQCRSGDTRIFSILLNDERVCTVQISGPGNLANLDEKATFTIVQNKGKANRSITSKAALDFCEETRATVEAAWRELCLKRKAAAEAEARRAAKADEERRAAHKAQLLGLPAPEQTAEPAAVGEKLKARRSTKSAKAADAPAAR